MKVKILSMIIGAMMVVACNQKKQDSDQPESQTTTVTSNTDTIATDTSGDTAKYACSMHPEVNGIKGEKCSKCGMELTEPVSN